MKTRPTRQDLNLACAGQALGRVDAKKLGGEDAARSHHLERIRDRSGLLKDFLLHEMTIGPQLNRISAQLTLHRSALNRPTVGIVDSNLVRANLHHIAVFEISDLARNLQKRRGIRG